jgi:hypothetical protein
MKSQLAFSTLLSLLAAVAAAQTPGMSTPKQRIFGPAPVVAGTLVGRLRLSRTEAVVDEQHRFKFDPERTACFTYRGDEAYATTCATLVGIGYADKARLTVAGDKVTRLDILELYQ